MRRSYEESGAPFCAGVRPCPGHRSPSEHPTSSTGPRPVPHRSVEAARSGPVDQIPISCPPDCSRDGSFDAAAGVYGDCPGSLNSALELSGVLAYLTSRHARKGSHPHSCRLPAQQRRAAFCGPAWARSQSCPAGHIPSHFWAFDLLNFSRFPMLSTGRLSAALSLRVLDGTPLQTGRSTMVLTHRVFFVALRHNRFLFELAPLRCLGQTPREPVGSDQPV
jgi:hypothetical protein